MVSLGRNEGEKGASLQSPTEEHGQSHPGFSLVGSGEERALWPHYGAGYLEE